MISKAEEVPLRELWKTEDKHFTPWLEENIDVLNEQAGFHITINEREDQQGDLFVDLVGEDENGLLVIENQLEKTDHDHLGKTITYLSMTGAKTAIWICSSPRPEHIKAFEWMNEITPADYSFYLILLKAIRIDNSPAAPIFSVVVSPSEIIKKAGKSKRDLVERHHLRKEFWTLLLDQVNNQSDLFRNISPRYDHWMGVGSGKAGISFNFTIFKDHAACEIYFDKGKGSEALNKERYDSIYSFKDKLESELSYPIIWQRLDEKRASRIKIEIQGSGLNDKEKWPKLQEKMIDAMMQMHKGFIPFVKKLK